MDCNAGTQEIIAEKDANAAEVLARLGQGDSIESACRTGQLDRESFPLWWQEQVVKRVPSYEGVRKAAVDAPVEIKRDKNGVPHIFAEQESDLYMAYGYAMAQDRLWQLDYYRRQAQGTLSEVLGAEAKPEATGGAIRAIDRDIVARTIGFRRIAQTQWVLLDQRVGQCLESFVAGINHLQEEFADNLPIEFALLDYQPLPWHPVDALSIWVEFQYYLTVRLPVIVMPELARRELADDDLFQAYLLGEADDESILPPTEGNSGQQAKTVGKSVGDPLDGGGSNNWAVAGGRTANGHALLASDPHIAFNAISCWYEVHLANATGLNVAGAGYIGVPGILFGRNLDVAWGITNNICSQRDLFLEETSPEHVGHFRKGDQWVPAESRTEVIGIRDQDSLNLTVESSPNGPIVNHLLPDFAQDIGPVSLKWMGATGEPSSAEAAGKFEVGAMMMTNRARNCQEFRSALRDWRVPTLSMVFADIHGHIGYQCAGRIPLRSDWTRGFRRGGHTADEWQDNIPFAGMPAMEDPEQGWIRTANNRTAYDDFPFPLSGTWASGYRAKRIKEALKQNEKLSRADCMRLQMDTYSMRAEECLPHLQTMLADEPNKQVQQALEIWEKWDRRMDPDTVGGTLFETFFALWQQSVAAVRFSQQTASYLAGGIAGLAVALLKDDEAGWFRKPGERRLSIINTLLETWHSLCTDLGPEASLWHWRRVHRIRLDHPLTYLPALGDLFNRGGQAVGGSGITICNTGVDPNYMSSMGANYRIVAELDADSPVLYGIDAAGQSGHPGSPHYCDQLPQWLNGQLKPIPLTRSESAQNAVSSMVLEP